MKKLLYSFLTIIFLLSQYTNVYCETESLFSSLIGKGRHYIEKHYPDYIVYNNFGGPWNGYYIIGNMRCESGGNVALLVGFDGYKTDNEVSTVSLYVKDCTEYIPHNTLTEASKFFIEMFGINDFYSQSKIIVNNNIWLSLLFPDNVFFDSYMKFDKNGDVYFIADCQQIIPED